MKNKFKDVENITYAKIHAEVGDNGMHDLYLDINSTFKMVVINYIGNIKSKFIDSIYKDLIIKHSNSLNMIIIKNPKKISLKNNILFKYRGYIQKFKDVKVYGWNKGFITPQQIIPSETASAINKNSNIVGTSSDKFYG